VVRTTPFHPRLKEFDETGLFTHWQGHLSSLRYQPSVRHEYFAVRAAVGVFDASPLLKYRVRGPQAVAALASLLARDVRRCAVGRAQYTVWCDDDGHVLEDGVVFRHGEDDLLLTAARPNLGWLRRHLAGYDADVSDVSDDFGVLAVQGVHSREVLAALSPDVAALRYFALTRTAIAGVEVVVSRTGYTGDLGYELLVPAAGALTVLDAVLAQGAGRAIRPFGEDALMMLRLEAGLPLLDVDFSTARFAWTPNQRFTPTELGLGRTVGLDDDRTFVGKAALLRERANGSARWATVGLLVDPAEHRERYREAGLPPSFDDGAHAAESMLYAGADGSGPGGAVGSSDEPIGYTTTRGWSPMLQRHVALARVRPQYATVGTRLQLETTIDHSYRSMAVEVAALPLFDPPRRTDASDS
jgi:aminomethyltransferase